MRDLRLTLELIDGTMLENIDSIISLRIDADIFAAADSFCISFAYGGDMPEIVRVWLFDGNELEFRGFCDKQTVEKNGSLLLVRLECRSLAAPLVDNGYCPGTYGYLPFESLIRQCEILSGFDRSAVSQNVNIEGVYDIKTGMSHYDVFADYVWQTLMTRPRIDEKGVLRLNWITTNMFGASNEEDNMTGYISAVKQYKRACTLSRVYTRAVDGTYTVPHTNSVISNHSITRVAYRAYGGRSEGNVNRSITSEYGETNAELEQYRVLMNATDVDSDEFRVGDSMHLYDSALGENGSNLLITGRARIADKDGDRVLVTASPMLNVCYY